MEKIIDKQNYLTPSRYISGRIVEYDIKSANISVLREYDHITQDDYDILKVLPKSIREKEIGLREKRDPSIYTKIQSGIKDAKNSLAAFNKIEDDQIVRIANDAVYINSTVDLKYTKFGTYIEFRPKSEYNIYCNLKGVIIFCKFAETGDIKVDIKNIGQNMYLHHDYMVYTIVSTITLLERSSVEAAIDYLSDICEQYLRRELPIGYYREFNSESMYKSLYMSNCGYNYGLSNVYDNQIFDLDINYNYVILRELWSILLEIYSMRRR